MEAIACDQLDGIVVPKVESGPDLKRVVEECTARNIRIVGGPARIRIATHGFTQSTELNTFFDAVEAGLRG